MNRLQLKSLFIAALASANLSGPANAAPEGVVTDIGVNVYDIVDPVAESSLFDYYVEVENFDAVENADAIDITINITNGFITGSWFDLEGGDWNCTPGSFSIDCSFEISTGGPAGDGLFPPGYQSTFKFEVMAPTSGNVQADAMVTNTSPPDGNSLNNNDTEITTVTPSGNVSLRIDSLSGVPDPVVVGNDITYTVNASYYDDPGDALDFVVSATNFTVDITPQDPGAIANPVSDANWTCGLASRGPVGTGMTCTLNNPLMPGMSVPPLVQTVTAPTTPGMLQTDFNIYADQSEVNTSDNFAPQLTDISSATPNASMRVVTALVSPTDQVFGGPLNYTVDVENWDDAGDPADTANATNVHIWLIPSDPTAAFSGATGTDWVCSPAAVRPPTGTIQCDLTTGPLPLGSAPTLDAQWLAPMNGGVFQMDIQVFADEPDNNISDNQALVDVNMFAPESSLRISGVVDTPDPVVVGGTVDYDVTVEHWDDPGSTFDGVAPTGVMLDITPLTPGVTITAGGNSDWTCMAATPPNWVCDLQISLPVGTTSTVPIQVTAPGSTGPMDVDFNVFANEPDPNTADNNLTEQTAVVTGMTNASLEITSASSTPPTQVTGGPIDYSVDVSNVDDPLDVNDGLDATGVHIWLIPSDPSASFDSVVGSDWSCALAPTGPPPGTIQCDLITGPLALGPAPTLDVTMLGPSSASVFQMDIQLFANEPDTNTSNNQVLLNTNIGEPESSLRVVSATDVPDPVLVDGTVDYDVVVEHWDDPASVLDGNVPTGVVLDVFALTPGVVLTAGGNADWLCSTNRANKPAASKGPVSGMSCLKQSAFLLGTTSNLPIQATAPSTPGTMDVDFVISANEPDPNVTDNPFTEQTSVGGGPVNASLTFDSVIDNPDPVIGGDPISYQLAVHNYDDPSDPIDESTATNVVVNASFSDPNASFGSVGNAAWSCSVGGTRSAAPKGGDSVSCQLQSPLAANTVSQVLDIEIFSPTMAPSIDVDFDVFADQVDSNPSDNFHTENTTIVPSAMSADLEIVKGVDNASPTVGDQINFSLDVRNLGQDPANNVKVIDTLPPGLTWVANSGPPWSCSPGAMPDVVECVLAGPLPPTGLVEFPLTLGVTADTVGMKTNSGAVEADEVDPDIGNNKSTVDVDVQSDVPVATLDLVITDTVDPVVEGNAFEYEITVTNNGPDTANDVELAVTFNGNISLVNPPAVGWSCQQGNTRGVVDLICLSDTPLLAGESKLLPLGMHADSPGPAGADVDANADETTGVVSASETTQVVPEGVDLAMVKTASASEVMVGQPFTYLLTVQNLGDSAVSRAGVSDALPAGFAFASLNAAGWSCSNNDGELGCVLTSTLAAGASSTIQVNGTATEAGTQTNTATVTGPAPDDQPGNNTDSATVEVKSDKEGADLEMDVSASVSSVAVGNQFDFVMTLVNNGPEAATGVVVDNQFDSNMSLVSASGSGWACPSTKGSQAVQCTLNAPLDSGGSSALTLRMLANQAGVGTNTATASANEVDPNPSDNVASDSVTLQATGSVSDLRLSKTVDQAAVNPGGLLEYTITVNNLGPDAAGSVRVTDQLPDGFDLAHVSAADFSCNPGSDQVLICDLARLLDSGESVGLIISGVVTAQSGTLINTAEVNSSSTDPQPANNSDSAASNVAAGRADLVMSKSVDLDNAAIGDKLTYTLSLSNAGPQAAVGARFVDQLPDGVDVESVAAGGLQCASNGSSIACEVDGLMAVGASFTTTVTVVVNASGQLVNSVEASANTADPDPSNNTASASTNVAGAQSDLSIQATVEPTVAAPGDVINVSVEVQNSGPASAPGVTVIDEFGPGLDPILTAAKGTQCNVSNGSLSCSLGTLAAGETGTLSFGLLVGDVTGSVTNVVRVESDNEDPSPGDNELTTEITILPVAADLAVSKTASVDSAVVGESFTYTIDLVNNGPGTATGVVLTDTLPTNIVVDSIGGSPLDCQSAGQALTCQVGMLAADQAVQLLLDVHGSQAGTAVNSVVVEAASSDPVFDNNQADASVLISGQSMADLALEKLASVNSATVGDTFAYRLVASNSGPDVAQEILVVDHLPSEIELISANGAGWSCDTDGSVLSCEKNRLAVAASSEVNVLVRAVVAGNASNTAQITSSVLDPDDSNNLGKADVLISSPTGADLALSKTVRESEVLPGDTVTFDLRVINNGPGTAENTVLIDHLPDALTLVSINGANCSSGAVISCTLGDLAPSQQIDIVLIATAGDDAGNAINTASVSSDTPDPVPGNNQDQAGFVVEMPGEGEIADTINGALPGSATPNQRNNVRPLARLCARANNNNPDFCRALIRAAREGRGGEIQNALQNLVPEQVITQGTSVTKLTSAQGRNIESRLQQLRGGGGTGVSINGLTFRHGNESISLGLLQYLGEDEDEPISSSDDLDGLISPWGFFINGMISGGDRDPTTNALGFDFETYGLTAGVDYRPSATSVMGVALGYASFDSDLQDGSSVDTKGYTLTGYGSFYPNERLFIDARISYGMSDFEQLRKVNFTLGDFSVDRTAIGRADGNDFSAGIAAGYNLYSDSWSFTPGGSLRYLRADIDGFTETGAGAQNITYGEQSLTSLLFSANFSASKSISTTRGVITPQFDLAYHYEGKDDGVIIEAALAGANSDERFLIQSDSPDRHYGSAGVGLVFVSPRGRQFFLSYRGLLGLEGTSQYTVNFGGRFEFD